MPLDGARFVDADGVATRYFVHGDGPPLVLLHGGNTGSVTAAHCAEDFDLNVAGLARHYRVFAVDRLGQGLTGNPRGDADYTIAASVRHTHATLRALGLSQVHLVGHSRGGYVAAALTAAHPELVASVTVIDSNTLAPGIGRNDIVFHDLDGPRLTRESQRRVLEKFCCDPACVTDGWVDALTAVAARDEYKQAVDRMVGAGLLHSQFLPQLEADKEMLLARIRDIGLQRPTLLAWGYDDPTASMRLGIELYEILAAREHRSRFHVFNRAGHFCYREHPARFNAVVHGFIQHA
ncbi:MAG: alpha/beta fold hydrolase [Rhodospirillaceae bacterium]